MPRGAWFVGCMCAISAGEDTAGLQAIRNADTASYLPAMTITRRGGFVIRMGDADALAAACEGDRLWPERHALRLDGYFPSGA